MPWIGSAGKSCSSGVPLYCTVLGGPKRIAGRADADKIGTTVKW